MNINNVIKINIIYNKLLICFILYMINENNIVYIKINRLIIDYLLVN